MLSTQHTQLRIQIVNIRITYVPRYAGNISQYNLERSQNRQ